MTQKSKGKESCHGCSYYELTVLWIFPYEYCYKHDWENIEPSDFHRCRYYTTNKWIAFKTFLKSVIWRFEI